jgi:hypothetical protein
VGPIDGPSCTSTIWPISISSPSGGKTVSWPLEEARQKLGSYADALVLDQQASGRRAEQELGWRPHRPGVLEEMERGSYRLETPV